MSALEFILNVGDPPLQKGEQVVLRLASDGLLGTEHNTASLKEQFCVDGTSTSPLPHERLIRPGDTHLEN